MAKKRKLSKKKKQQIIYFGLVTAAVIGAVYIAKKGIGYSRLEWYSRGFKIQNKKLYYRVEIINPSSTALTINNVFLNFYRDNYLIGKIFFNTKTTIPANQQLIATLPVDILPVGVALLIKDLIQNIKAPFDIRVSGGVKGDGVNVPIDEKIKITPADYLP